MKLFCYYALHTFKNQLRKLFKTWVLIYLVVCVVVGIVVGLFAAFLDDSASEEPDAANQAVVEEMGELPSESVEIPMENKINMLELAVGGVSLILFVFYVMNADKNGSRIFHPADVGLLFASPMKPQSVLLFRIATQLGLAVIGSIYILFLLPNLVVNAGLTVWTAVSIIAAWCFTVLFSTFAQVLLYMLSSTHAAVRRFLRPVVYGTLLIAAGAFLLYSVNSQNGYVKSAALFFNAPVTRFIPIWGWIKGICVFAAEENIIGFVLCFLLLVAAGVALAFIIRNTRADFYEDAMAKSEETAELLAKAQSEKSSGIVLKRKKDRSEKLRRDSMRHGAGANVFFFKSLYNRFRFAHLGVFTKTMETYLVLAVMISLVCRYFLDGWGVMPVALALAVFSFVRALGNPLEQDTKMDCFTLIPESTWAKLFWSMAGGTVNCFLDVLPAMVVAAVVTGTNIFAALAWVPLIVSVDFYSANVGAFIGLSVPVSAGKMVKQIVQIMFVYFGLLPDIAAAALGIVFEHVAAGMIAAALINFGLGFLFFGLSPIFIDPKGGKRREKAAAFSGDLKLAKRQFSIIGLGLFAIMVITNVLQLAVSALVVNIYPQGGGPSWLLWVCTFAPMYLVAVPLGLLIMKRVPRVQREGKSMGAGKFVSAAIISIFAMYAGNIIGNIILSLIYEVIGADSANPLLVYALDDSQWLRILIMVIIGPVIEEYIFRKQLIDRTNVYGEKLAVFTSALIFGLFHGNLSQFFYAFALGLIFGYVYLKTGRLRYSAALHMMVNFLGSVVAPAVLGSVDPAALGADMSDPAALKAALMQMLPLVIYVLAIIALSLAGLVLFCINVRKVSFGVSRLELTKGLKFKTVWLNVGMILFAVVCLASIVLTFVV